jgi:hypothetical protein
VITKFSNEYCQFLALTLQHCRESAGRSVSQRPQLWTVDDRALRRLLVRLANAAIADVGGVVNPAAHLEASR